jgi:hypothetical protein
MRRDAIQATFQVPLRAIGVISPGVGPLGNHANGTILILRDR